MRHPFLHRLRLERALIRTVNSRLPGDLPQLAGTSENAVHTWLSEIRKVGGNDMTHWQSICDLIVHVGLRLRLNSDASHRGYSEERLLAADESSALIREIGSRMTNHRDV